MANPIHFVLMAFAVVFFGIAAFVPFAEPSPYRYRLVAAGLFAMALAILLNGLVK